MIAYYCLYRSDIEKFLFKDTGRGHTWGNLEDASIRGNKILVSMSSSYIREINESPPNKNSKIFKLNQDYLWCVPFEEDKLNVNFIEAFKLW